MTQSQLERAVARATCESRRTIQGRGFSLLADEPPGPLDPDEPPRLVLDCPGCGREVHLSSRGLVALPDLAECPRCDAAYPYTYAEVHAADALAPLPAAA
jgi:hypothetical protein